MRPIPPRLLPPFTKEPLLDLILILTYNLFSYAYRKQLSIYKEVFAFSKHIQSQLTLN
jgi:hypothetical protein